jgi:hypothetical protein
MVKFCASCGTANTPDARFCAKCGHAIKVEGVEPASSAEPVASEAYRPIASPPMPDPVDPAPVYYESADIPDELAPARNWVVIGAVIGTLLVIGALYFWLFVADDMGGTTDSSYDNKVEASKTVEAKQMFAMTEANIRDKPTTIGSVILGKMPRGSAVTGVIKLGEDGTSEWLELADGKGFIGVVNLSDTEPPQITKALNDTIWEADGPVEIWSQPDSASTLVDRVSEGTKLTLAGLTANDYIEIKLRAGGVGYIADGAAILARAGGKPIAISFNPATCNFGGEIGAEFAKIGAKLKAQWAELENREYPDEAAREKAYAAVEGKSTFVCRPGSEGHGSVPRQGVQNRSGWAIPVNRALCRYCHNAGRRGSIWQI